MDEINARNSFCRDKEPSLKFYSGDFFHGEVILSDKYSDIITANNKGVYDDLDDFLFV